MFLKLLCGLLLPATRMITGGLVNSKLQFTSYLSQLKGGKIILSLFSLYLFTVLVYLTVIRLISTHSYMCTIFFSF